MFNTAVTVGKALAPVVIGAVAMNEASAYAQDYHDKDLRDMTLVRTIGKTNWAQEKRAKRDEERLAKSQEKLVKIAERGANIALGLKVGAISQQAAEEAGFGGIKPQNLGEQKQTLKKNE